MIREASVDQNTGVVEVVWLTNSWHQALEFASEWGFNGYPYVMVKVEDNQERVAGGRDYMNIAVSEDYDEHEDMDILDYLV